jgi:hypothetical protein
VDYSELKAASQPEALRAALAARADDLRQAADPHHGGEMASMRTANYKGHEIVVKTTYEITVDGQPFDVHLTVDNSGRVHYHGLPTRDFGSTIDLVKKAIDFYPNDFGEGNEPMPPDDHGGGHHHGGGG